MGIDVRLENERGEALKWASGPLPTSLRWDKLPFYDSSEFPLAGGIDPYGDTVFNRVQAPQLMREWDVLISIIADADRKIMDEVARLIEECRDGVHLYIRFVGD